MITNVSTSYNNISNIFGQVSFNNISLLNSSNTSTMITGSESLILKSIKTNKKTISFQNKNRKLKNDIKSLKRINVENYSYRNLLFQKSLINMKKNETIKSDFSTNKSQIYNKFYNIIKNSCKNVDPNSSLTNKIIEQVYDKNVKKLSAFSKKMKAVVLLKKFIHFQKQNYENKLIENEMNDSLIINLNQKLQNISFIIKELDNILTLFSYVKYLGEKIRELKNENMLLYTKIDYLKNDINELVLKIRTKADKLADLINIRNLLVCIKEGILMKDLPFNFKFYNENYKNTLDNIIKSLNHNNIQLNESDDNNTKIPKNLVESIYSKNINKMKNIIFDNRYKNYLKINYPIFKSEEVFQKYFYEMQNRINDSFIYILNKNYREYELDSDLCKNEDDNMNIIKVKDIQEKKQYKIENLKKRNIFLNKYLKNIIKESKIIEEYKINNIEKNNLKNLNKLLLESVVKSNVAKNIKYIYTINQLQTEKKYKIKGAYIYHTLIKNILQIYKYYPKFILNQHCLMIEEFRFRINNFNNFIKSTNYQIIVNEIYYLFGIYESAISYFLMDLNNLKNKQSEISIFNNIRDNIFNNRKKELFRFKIGLEDKIKNAKFEKIYQKQNKKIIRRQNIYFPAIHLIKLKRNKSQERLTKINNNININIVNFDYSSLQY